MARAYVGTSGFSYDEWRPSFYPEDVKKEGMLSFFASKLTSVEINATFYRMPNAKTVDGWKDAVPDGFRFAVKASQKITHQERLRVPSESLSYMTSIVKRLEDRLGVVLFQLPPNFKADLERLERFLTEVPKDVPSAFEFRNDSWFNEDCYGLLRRNGVGLCINDSDESRTAEVVTSRLVYLRLRKSAYTPEDLEAWRGKVRGWVGEGLDVFSYVKHEENPDAPRIAMEFQQGIV